MTIDDIPVWELLVQARRADVKLRAIAGRPTRLFAWGTTSPEADRVIAAIQARADEVAPLLPQFPAPVDGEPETLAGDLPLAVLRAMVIALVYDTLDTIHAEEDWEREIADRDLPPSSPTLTVRRTLTGSVPTLRVREVSHGRE